MFTNHLQKTWIPTICWFLVNIFLKHELNFITQLLGLQ